MYALQRKTLVEAREKVARDLLLLVQNLEDGAFSYLDAQKRENRTAERRHRDSLDRNMGGFAQFLKPSAPFLALVRSLVRKYNRIGRFDELKKVGINPMSQVRASEGLTG